MERFREDECRFWLWLRSGVTTVNWITKVSVEGKRNGWSLPPK